MPGGEAGEGGRAEDFREERPAEPGTRFPVVRRERNTGDARARAAPRSRSGASAGRARASTATAPRLRVSPPPARRRRRGRPCPRPRPQPQAGARRAERRPRSEPNRRGLDWPRALPEDRAARSSRGDGPAGDAARDRAPQRLRAAVRDRGGAHGALRVPRLHALHRGLGADDERAAHARRLPARRRRLRGGSRRARRGLRRGDLLAERARPPRGGLGRDLQRVLRRRAGGARAVRRRDPPDARHRPRFHARGSARGRSPCSEVSRSRRRRRRPRRPRGAVPARAVRGAVRGRPRGGTCLGSARRRGRRPRVGARRARLARRREDQARHSRRRGSRARHRAR